MNFSRRIPSKKWKYCAIGLAWRFVHVDDTNVADLVVLWRPSHLLEGRKERSERWKNLYLELARREEGGMNVTSFAEKYSHVAIIGVKSEIIRARAPRVYGVLSKRYYLIFCSFWDYPHLFVRWCASVDERFMIHLFHVAP